MNRNPKAFDLTLIFTVIALTVFGIIIIGSATRININGIQGRFTSQMLWFATGMILMFVFAFWDYHKLCKLYIPIYLLNITLLVLVLTMGSTEDNVRRWLFGIQPSEFAKIFMIIYLSKLVDKSGEKINNISRLFFVIITSVIPFVLIKIQPSLSASLVILAILITELYLGNISDKYIKLAIIVIVPVIIILYLDIVSAEHRILSAFLSPYQINRITTAVTGDLSDPRMYQTKNSIWAIGSGQLKGKGLFNGTINQLNYLPYSYNDFIFSVIGEEFGFLGCAAVLLFMLILISRCINIALSAEDRLGTLIAGGVAGMIFFQTFVNVGVATGLLPNTGMALPFLSYGGSSMWANMIAIGMVLNVGKKKPKTIF